MFVVILFFGLVGCSSVENKECLRIHIRANSNSAQDQQIKYLIKDKVVEFLTPLLVEATDKQKAKQIVLQNQKEISTCNRFIELTIGIAPTLFAPPSGAYGKVTISACEALNMKTPGDIYQPSQRQYPETIERFEYGGEYHVIKVNSWGYVRFDKWQVYLSETMIDQYIEFRPSPDGESFIACYRNFKIAEFDTEDGHLIHRSIARI